jgi:nicotinamide-nucleotide amidase
MTDDIHSITVAILTIGSELTEGRITDTNARWIAGRLMDIGWRTVLKLTVDDDPAAIGDALGIALARARVVWITGGLGPTRDDLSVSAVADALGLGLREDPGTVERIRGWYARHGRVPGPMSLAMARVPAPAEALDNPVGSAPGIWLEAKGSIIVMMAGVPSEMMAIAEASVLPRLAILTVAPVARVYRILGMPEGEVDRRIRDVWEGLGTGEAFALQIHQGEVLLRARVVGGPGAMERLAMLDAAIRERLGDAVYALDDDSLEAHLVAKLRAVGATIAFAESVTGGLVAARMTGVAGASDVVRGGMVTYREESKIGWLGIPAVLLAAHGPVSAEVTVAMAHAARRAAEATWAVATTGWAGPGGGTPADPVGTVYVAVASAGGETVERRWIRGGRAQVREIAVTFALDLLRRRLPV